MTNLHASKDPMLILQSAHGDITLVDHPPNHAPENFMQNGSEPDLNDSEPETLENGQMASPMSTGSPQSVSQTHCLTSSKIPWVNTLSMGGKHPRSPHSERDT